MNIGDYINTTRINDAVRDMQNTSFDNIMQQGLLTLVYQPFIALFGSFFWSLTFGIIGIAIYSWKGIYPTIGFIVAILLITSAVIPMVMGNILSLMLGLIITVVLYEVLVVKRKNKAQEGK
jgi:ABC-type multidrug transport system fused ATPase/permease subunit